MSTNIQEIEIIEDDEFNNAPTEEVMGVKEYYCYYVGNLYYNRELRKRLYGETNTPFMKLVFDSDQKVKKTQQEFDKNHPYNLKGIRYCEKHKCFCGFRKAWNLSDNECEVHRPHGNGIVTAKNRAIGKYV